MISLLILLSIFSPFLLISSQPTSQCPTLPPSCQCSVAGTGRISVTCEDVDIKRLVKVLGSTSIERLRILKSNISTLNELPKGFIRSIEIVNCGVKSVDAKVFSHLSSSLEELVLANNSLTAVPLLGTLGKLNSLNLNGNQLTDVAEKSLEGLRSLRYLRLRDNRICNLSPNALNNETKATLELLDLSANCLSRVPAQNLRSSDRLMHLDLSDNKISEINNFELMNLKMLREIRLNNNQLNNIHPMGIMNVPQLEFLYLRDNLIAALDGSKLQAFKQLAILDVTNNLLQKLPILKDMPNLQQVILDGNLIERIDTLAFSNNPRLQLISLQNNNISQLSRNSFDALDQMIILLLGNNSITSLERGMLDGMRNLQQLSFRNNSLGRIDGNTFSSVAHLSTLDLAHNKLEKIDKGTFAKLAQLFWLDLSNNKLTGFEKDSFNTKLANILLDGNQFICNDSLDWFIEYLVVNHIRTFLPFQPDIKCIGPEDHAGMELKDLMMKKANEISLAPKTTSANQAANNQGSIFSSLLPGLGGLPGAINGQQLSSLTAEIPGLSQMLPGLEPVKPSVMTSPSVNPNSVQAQNIKRNLATLSVPEIQELMKSMPSFVVNIPGLGPMDISTLDPNLAAHVLRGGQIPGVPKENLDQVIDQYVEKMRQSLAQRGPNTPVEQNNQISSPHMMDTSVIQQASQGSIQGADPTKTNAVSEFHTRSIAPGPGAKSPSAPMGLPAPNPQTLELMKLLPPGYDLSKIPADIILAISKGQVPDLKKLPADLLEHFKSHTDHLANLFTKATSSNASIEDILSKLPNFDRPPLTTFSPYDINKLTSDMIHEEEHAKTAAKMRLYTAIILGVVGAATIVVLVVFAIYMKRQRETKTDQHMQRVSTDDSLKYHPEDTLGSLNQRQSIGNHVYQMYNPRDTHISTYT